MNRKIKLSVLITLCVVLIGTMLFWGVNSIKAEATERTIVASGTNVKVNWTLFDDGELYIDGTGCWVDTPWKSYYSSIKKITLAKGVTASTTLNFYFNNLAGYKNLENVNVEDGNTAFYADENGVLYSYDKTKLFLFPNASGLTEYNIPDSVTTIVKGAFCGNKTIAWITGCNGLKAVEANSFYSCSALKSITLPEGLTTIGNYAFYQCSSLETISIPDSVTELGNYAFKGCSVLAYVSVGSGITNIPLEAFMNCKGLESISFGNNIKAISESTFKNCSKLTDVTIPEGVTFISKSAFNGCSSLENVTLNAGLSQINMSAFLNCTALKNVYYIGDSAGWCSIEFSNETSNPLYYAENLYINGKLVTEFVVPDGITVFKSCLFTNYDKLTSITLPDSVIVIDANAFYGCSSLTAISVSDNLEFIGESAFGKTGYYNDAANWDNGFLYLGNYLIDVDDDIIASECKLYSKTKLVAEKAFYCCDKITSLEMPDSVEYINNYAFYKCTSLSSVKLSANLKKISDCAFSYCSTLSEINIPQNITSIEKGAFFNCTSLTKIRLFENVEAIKEGAFNGCVNLESVTLNKGLTEIGSTAFGSTASLTEICIPQTVTSLAYDAFNSSGITDIYYGDSKAEWKRLVNGATFNDATVHYTLRSDDESVIINHTDKNFDWEAGNVHLVVEDLGNASSTYEQNGFYNRLMVDPIQVLDIKLVDGDGNDIQPLSDEKITVKIKASEEFMNLMKSGLAAVSEYNVDAENIDFINDCFVFEINGETVTVAADEGFLKKIKIIHWYSDATQPTDHEGFTHDEITVENGYIILETNHFSEYAVCTELEEAKDYTIKWIIDGVVTEQTVTEGSTITKPAIPEKEGYTFVGWTPEIPDTMPAENLEFTTVWQVNKYTITFDTAGGTELAPITLEYGAVITQPDNPQKDGYTFVGWNPELPETMPANDLTVVAVYEEAETPDVPEPPTVTVKSIKIVSLPRKTNYIYKYDNLDLSGLVIKIIYSDGSSKIINDTKTVNAYGFNNDTVGTKTVTVSYGGYTDEFEITVSYAWWQWIIRILFLGFIWY